MKSKFYLPIGFGLLLVFLILFLINGQPSEEPFMEGNTEIEIVKTGEQPDGLHPIVRENKDRLIERAADKGIAVLITDGFRSIEEQNTLYEQGRSAEGEIVTNAEGGTSYHNYGLAIDFAIENEEGRAIWDMEYDGNNNGISDWTEVVDIAKELGFEWGGDWQGFRDFPHLQMTFGLRIRQLKNGYRPVVVDSEN